VSASQTTVNSAPKGARPRLLDVEVDELKQRCRQAISAGGRLQMAYAWFPRGNGTLPEVRYVVHSGAAPLEIWRCQPRAPSLPSLAAISPLLSWYEREITDLCGLSFEDAPQPEPLVLLPGARPSTPPLEPGTEAVLRYTPMAPTMPEVSGHMAEDVQVLPWGPIRADVFESAQFDFYYIGEAILHYHPQLFFKHRGMEKRFEGIPAELGAILAERVSGVGSIAHSLAYCQAMEAAAGCEIPVRARWLRVLLAELERLYNHFHYFGHLAHTTTLKVGEAEGKLLEERVKQVNAIATGHRLLRGLLTPGGLRREPNLDGISEALQPIRTEGLRYTAMLEATTTHLDRLITTGVLSQRVAFDQGATGPVERASGLDRDLRRDQPYAAYDELPIQVTVKEAGDAHARQQVRIAETSHIFDIIDRVLGAVPDGPIRVPCVVPASSEGLGWSESPRGSLYYAVHVDQQGRLARVKIKSPSFSNWRTFPFTVHESNMMDYAINEASFGLTIAGADR
jgi:Ni,Fe-hydrogenase III large subunit